MEPFPRYPVFDRVAKQNVDAIIIAMIIILIIVIAFAVVAYSIYRPTAQSSIAQCEPGLCAVNIGTGVKRCPAANTGQVIYDAVFEDCTSKNYCQSTKAPCAVLPGGTLNCNGVCGPNNDECNCAPEPT